MGFTAIVGDKTRGQFSCYECGVILYEMKSEKDIDIDIKTDYQHGVYPVILCWDCWDFWRDSSKKSIDNPRSQANIGI